MPPAFRRRRSWHSGRSGWAARKPPRPRTSRVGGPRATSPLAPKIHRYSDTPTNATISGRNRRTLSRKTSTPAAHSRRRQRADARCFARDEVRDAEPPFRQPVICAPVDRFRHQFRVEQELPEAVGVAGEMMPGLRGTDAGIDADKQHTHPRRDAIAKSLSRAGSTAHLEHARRPDDDVGSSYA